MDTHVDLCGAGLGFRRELIAPLKESVPNVIDFFEVAPENWIDIGGALGKSLRYFTERYPFVCHGLSLSIGGPSPLDLSLLKKIKEFLHQHNAPLYTEHLSYCSDDGHLYDLMPIPFTFEAANYVANRIRQIQDILERKIAIENTSFYVMAPIAEMTEIDFIKLVLEEADCLLHLDVNNVYVNSVNHGYDSMQFIRSIPQDRIAYIHIAGHYHEMDNLIVDSHGAAVIQPVWKLLDETYKIFGVFPTLLERDQNIPPLSELAIEVGHIAQLQQKWRMMSDASAA